MGAGERHLYRVRDDTSEAPECLTCHEVTCDNVACHEECRYTEAILDPGGWGYIQVRITKTN